MRRGLLLKASLVAALGFGGTVWFVMALNLHGISKQRLQQVEVSRLDVKPKPPQQDPLSTPKPVAKPRPKSPPPPTIPTLLGSVDFGVGTPEWLLGDGWEQGQEKDLSNLTMTSDSVDQPPMVTARGDLEYPETARREGIEGFVEILLLINALGSVESSEVVSSEPQGVFDGKALAFVQTWRFQPARFQGEPVRVWVRQKIHFDLGH